MAAPMEQLRQLYKRSRFLRHFLSGGLPIIVDEDVMDELNQVKLSKKISLEKEYERMKEENIDDWYNIRGPRPWENSKEYQDAQRINIGKRKQQEASNK